MAQKCLVANSLCFGEAGFRIPKVRLLGRHEAKQAGDPDLFNLVHPVEEAGNISMLLEVIPQLLAVRVLCKLEDD